MAETGLDRGEIVTLREEGSVKTDAGIIRIVPAWRWLLEREEPS
jgi:predicted AAA+ superfamily ATPase